MAPMTVIEAGPGSLADYYDWYQTAATGAVLVYHTGDLQFDRDQDCVAIKDQPRARHLSNLASRILMDSRDGFLVLTQKRLGPGRSQYRATRKRQPPMGSEPVNPRHADLAPA